MLKSMTFNGARNNSIYLLRGRSKSPYHGIARDITRIGKHHRLKKTEKELLPISQPIGFVAKKDETQIEIIEQLTSWLITDDWATLEFDDEPGRKYVAVLQNSMDDFEKISWLREGTLDFVAKETLGAEKAIEVTTSTQVYEITGQASTPWTSKAVFEAPASQYTMTVNNGLNIELNYDFIAGDILRIDADRRLVTLNGYDKATSVSLDTNWLGGELHPGSFAVNASHATEIYYTERFY